MGKADEEKAEAARVRRRWLTLGEILAIVAVVISALTFWNSYSERRTTEAEHQADRAKTGRVAATLLLKGTADDEGRRLALAPRAEGQGIDSQTITFPAALGVDTVETTGDPRIERDWFASALVKARHAAGAKDETGDAKLPVMIETRFVADGETHVARDLYTIGYAADSAFLSGTRIKLRGLSRTGPAKDAATGARALAAAWKVQLPAAG